MKFQLNLVINGNDSLDKKLEQAIKDNPKLHVDLIRSFVPAFVKYLKIDGEDNLSVERFSLAKVNEEQKKN